MKIKWIGRIDIEVDANGNLDEVTKLVGAWSDVIESMIAYDFECGGRGTVTVRAIENRIE